MHKTFSGIILTLLLSGMLITAFIIQPVSSESSLTIEFPARGKHVPRFETLKEGEPNSTVRDEGNINNGNERSEFNGDDKCSTQLVIRINNRISDAYTQLMGVIAKYDCEVVNTVSMAGEVIAVVVDVSSAEEPSLTREISADGLSSYIEHRMKFQSQIVPNDPYWSLQWGPQKIEADWAWNTTIGDPSVLVAVIDTGIDWDHPDLAANYVALGYDWVNNDTDPMDDNGHGTHCAGIIAAVINNSIGVAGLAQVRIMAEKGLDQYGQGYEDDLANAIIHAVDQGADILSNSWGSYGESALIHEAIKYAYDSGVLVVAAAGNEATSNKLYPAAYDEVIAVSATDKYDNPAYFTNFGEWVELAAPGVDIYSTYWDNTYRSMSGTSMSTPHVSGVAALIWSQFPNMTRDWVRAQLRFTADDLGDLGFDNYYGYGRINARNAVEQAPPDHDLLIFDWERPLLVKLGELATFNTTVLNFGISDETNVEVQLLVNSSLIDSTSIAFLPGGESTTVGLSWTPTVEGTYNVTSYVVPVPEETITQNNLITEIVTVVAPPPETNWILLATDPDEGVGTSLKAIYGQLYSDIIYFKVEHYRPWTTINDIDTGIFIDADQDPSTGLPDGFYPGQNTGIGADYVIVVGWQATKMWKWDPIAKMWDLGNPISLAYLDAPDGSNVFVVGVYLASVETGGILDCAVGDVVSGWDWMPDAGYFTWILIRYEHELTVFLEAPQRLEPGETSLLNATVYNVGLNNETNVEIQLLINGTEVASETLDELVNGTRYSINYSWTPTMEGIYNITAYTPPVPGENVTSNNIMSVFVNVQYLEVALFKNVDPWDYQANEEALSLYGIAYAVFSSIDFGLVDLSSFSKVVIASDQDQAFYNAMDAYRWWFEDYVSSGGVLEIHAADWGWHGGRWVGTLPGGLGWVHYASNYVTIVDPTHPVVTTPNPITDAELDGWSASVHGYFNSYPANSRIVIIEDSTGFPAYLEFGYGAGLILASSQTLEWAYKHRYSRILENSLLYTPVKYEHDLAVTLEAPTFLEPGESTVLNATVYNSGLSNETGVELQLLINSTLVDSVVLPELLTGASYTLSYLWTPTIEGIYNVTAYAPPVPSENITINNFAIKNVNVQVLPEIIIVNDDNGGNWIYGTSLSEFESALSTVGYDYWVWNESSMGNPPLEFLVKFRLVIWTCGDYWNRAVDTADAITLQSYLAQGGNILLEGEDIGYDHDADEFMVNVAHAIMQVDGTGAPGLTVTDPTHPVTFGLPNSFAWLINPPYDDGVSPTNGGAEVIRYTGTTWTAVTVFEGASNGSVVYYAFPLYCLPESHRETLAINSINWLLGIRYEHELAVSLEAPTFLEPGEFTMLNATVYNRGLSNETDVELQLLINGTEVESVVIPELLSGSTYTLSYLWTPTVEATYNVTAYAPSVPDEEYTRNNVALVNVKVRYVIARVAVLNSWDIPPYFTGGWSNDYQTLVDALNAQGFCAQAVTNEEITSGILSFFDVFAMVDNVPNDVAVPYVVDFWSNRGGIVAFDSSICFLCYAGLLPPESAGSNGYYVYWDYETSYQARIRTEHPITAGYEVGQIIYGTSGDAEYRVDALVGTSAYLYYTMLVEDVTRPNRAYVSAYEPPSAGKVVYIWDQYHWSNTNLQLMILNAIIWAHLTPVPPVASFTWTPSIPKVGEPVTFDASASTPNGGIILKYEWNFGDGETATGKVVSHTYTNPGTYTVTLNVTDSEGLWDIEQKQIQVVQPHGPEAEFTWTPTSPRTDESIKFDASASQPGWNGTHTMPITKYRWDFGDGNKTTTSTPIVYHSYKTAGNYYVTLTVYALGATPETDTITHRVTVISVPVGGYSFPIQVQTKTEPIITYIASLTIITMLFTKIKQKTKRKRISIG